MRASSRASSTAPRRSSTWPASRSAAGAGSAARKQALRDSRILATRSLVAALGASGRTRRRSSSAPAASATTATAAPSRSPKTPRRATTSSRTSASSGKRKPQRAHVHARSCCCARDSVLEKSGGLLPQMMRPFRFFAGGPIGSGRQYMPWVHRLDWIEMVRWIVGHARGVRSRQRLRAASGDQRRVRARARPRACTARPCCRRPASRSRSSSVKWPTPRSAASARSPAKPLAHGYHFRYPEIDIAFRGIFGD